MGQTPWPDASPAQQEALAFTPKLTSFLSILGSIYIIYDIVFRLPKRNTYHRIILGMNIMDLLSLCAWFFTTWPVPVGTEGVHGASGNQATCDAQGFFGQLSISTVLYNACLAIYFMLVIKWGWTERRIAKAKLEWFVHILCIGVGIGTAVIGQIMKLYNPAGWMCWIESVPIGCTESWDMPSGYHDGRQQQTADLGDLEGLRWLQQLQQDTNISFGDVVFLDGGVDMLDNINQNNTTNITASAPPSNIVPCTRGDNANFYLWFMFYFPLWTCIVVASLALYQVYAAYHRQDQLVEKWRQKLLMTATETSNRISIAASQTTRKLRWQQLQPMKRRRRPVVTSPGYTRHQRRKLMERQKSRSLSNRSVNNETTAATTRPQHLTPDSSESTKYQPVRSLSRSSSLGSSISSKYNAARQRGPDRRKLPPVLRANTFSGRTRQPNIRTIAQDEKQQTIQQKTKNVFRRTNTSDTAASVATRRKRQVNAKSQLVTSQALLYLLSFYVAWAFPSLLRIQESTSSEGIAYYHWVFLSAFFVPLQGLMNFIVYIRPKYLQIRREKQRLVKMAEQQKKFAARLDLMNAASSHHRRRQFQNATSCSDGDEKSTTANTTGLGSSSALMTFASEDAVADLNNHRKDCAAMRLGGSSHHSLGKRSMRKPGPSEHAVILEVDSDDDDDSDAMASFEGDSTGGSIADPLAVWTESDIAPLESGEGDHVMEEHNRSMQEEALTDLFDALNNTAHRGSRQTLSRPKLQRSNSSNSNFFSMRNKDDQILTDDELLDKFHSSVTYDSRGHVWVNQEGDLPQPNTPRKQSSSPKSSRRNQSTNSAITQKLDSISEHWTSAFRQSLFDRFRKRESSSLSASTHAGRHAPDAQTEDNSAELPAAGDSRNLQNSASSISLGNESFQSLQSVESAQTYTTAHSGYVSTGSTSVASGQSKSSPPPKSSSLRSSALALNRRSVSFVSRMTATPIVEESDVSDQETQGYIDKTPQKRTSKDHPINQSLRQQMKDVRLQKKTQQQQQQQQQQPPPDPNRRSNIAQHQRGASMSFVPMQDEKARRPERHLVRRVKTDPDKLPGLRRIGTAPVDPENRRDIATLGGETLRTKDAAARRSAHVDFVGNVVGNTVEDRPSVGSTDTGMSKKMGNRRDLLKKTKGTWISTKSKAGAKSLVKGGKKGYKSIRNFASDFKNALKVDAYDDWATALNTEDILLHETKDDIVRDEQQLNLINETEDGFAGDDQPQKIDQQSNHLYWERKPRRDRAKREEEKTEISDAFEEEHSMSSHSVAFHQKGSGRSLASTRSLL